MLLFKFTLFLVFPCILQSGGASYVYPLWGEQKLDKSADSSDGDGTVTEFIVTNFLLPMRDVFCNVCTNFLEVYTCIFENVMGHFGEKATEESQSYLDKTLSLFGLRNQQQNAPRSCSYYSILVVTVTIVLFVSLLFIAKKLVEYMKEEDRVFPQILTDYKSKCPCYQENE